MCVLNARGRVCDNQLEFDFEISAVFRIVDFFGEFGEAFKLCFVGF